ncbi:TPA: YfcC family protein [Bacillus thuringiensis]|nr:YfcC family protein [Bacillus thuringiensis]
MQLHTEVKKQPSKRKFKMPDAYVLLFFIALLCAIATYFVPAGEFKRVTNGTVTTTIPGSYHSVPQSPVGFVSFFTAIEKGMTLAAPIIFLILFTGGAIAILEKTGALDGLIYHVINKFRNQQLLFICIVAALFSILGTTGIIVNSVIGFIPIGIIVARTLKWDAIVGVAIIYLGTYAGFNATILSPSPLGISQKIAELPMFSGIGLRTAIYISFLIATILYINWYIKRLKKSNKGSILGDNWFPSNTLSSEKDTEKTEVPWTIRHKLILLVSALSLIVFLIGAFRLHWTDAEMTATFIFIAITAGIIGGMKANDIASTFLAGCQNLIYGALIVGMARCISVILEQGKLLDTIVNQLAQSLEGHSPVFGVLGMYVSSAALHFLISSGTGESVIFIPILAPLADFMHITRQVTVQAVMLGEGVVNCLNPTSGVLMGVLAASGISYGKWIRFMAPLAFIWFIIGLIFLIVGVNIEWGPY